MGWRWVTRLGVCVFFMEPVGVVSESNSIEHVVYMVLHWLSVALKGGFRKMVKKMSMRARTMPNQMTACSTHRVLIATVVCCVFLLSGCGLSTPLAQYLAVKNQPQSHQLPASSQVAEPETLGEVLEAGTGTFDPNDPNFTLFNPCTEISEEQYEKLGFKINELSVVSRESLTACGLFDIKPSIYSVTFTIGTDTTTYEFLESSGLLRNEPGLVLPEGMYVHTYPGEFDEAECTVAVSTNRGRLSISGIGSRIRSGNSRQMVCQQAVDKFQEFLDLKG
ncbi:hypothetical protein CMUST_14140 [Corynebacterium mustelae]|uniref:DUF3558 family protein n=1 Tax=Corynebacterium mustelae TaxID=571915 RepID=A0A0G3H173_9CORY|nr:DUF3558 family protein [Corynebacterium mustelae]AKK07121.1 hypothetical protein CMUST_14140 [Corynebacterium mustelae]